MTYYITRSVNGRGPETTVGGDDYVPTGREFSGCAAVRAVPRVTYANRQAAIEAIPAIRAADQGPVNARGGDLPIDYIVREL